MTAISLQLKVFLYFIIIFLKAASQVLPTTSSNVEANCSFSGCYQNSNQHCKRGWGGGGGGEGKDVMAMRCL